MNTKIEGSNKMGWTIEADKATARLELYEYTIRDRMQILATVKAENLDAALQLFSFGNLRLEFYFHGCATVEENGKVFGVTWRPIEHALAVNEHAALCEVENSLQDVLAWQKTYSNGECRAGDFNDAITDANCALEKLASIRTENNSVKHCITYESNRSIQSPALFQCRISI